jgi:hypothetical protein
MRVFNTGAANFWNSTIGEQLRLLKVTNRQFYQVNTFVRLLIEKIGKEVMPKCRQLGHWPCLDIQNGSLVFVWRGRGEICVSLKGTKISYIPDPIRKSTTIGMMFDLTSNTHSGSIEKFIKNCLGHLLEVLP